MKKKLFIVGFLIVLCSGILIYSFRFRDVQAENIADAPNSVCNGNDTNSKIINSIFSKLDKEVQKTVKDPCKTAKIRSVSLGSDERVEKVSGLDLSKYLTSEVYEVDFSIGVLIFVDKETLELAGTLEQ